MILSEVFAFLRFILDPTTRRNIRAARGLAGYQRLPWHKLIKTARAKVHGDRSYEITVFSHVLERDFQEMKIDDDIVGRFRVIFGELVDNAFRHGCKESHKHCVRIRCDYSPWFIRIEVADSGGGFNFHPDVWSAGGGTHGLDIAARLATSLTANTRGNRLTAFIAPRRDLEVFPTVETFQDYEIAVITISNRADWHYLVSDWEPLRQALALAPQRLVLINSLNMRWRSVEYFTGIPVIAPFLADPARFFAFVADLRTLGAFDLRALRRNNSQVFDRAHFEQAKSWLVDQERAAK